jgi:ribonuclease VapC
LTIFADASALIAITIREDDALELAECLQRDRSRLYSAIAAWEAVAGLTHTYAFLVHEARERLRLLLDALDFQIVSIGEPELIIAMEAYARFGKGRHPAKLNMGDCYAYACARTNQARLLFKGGDFAKTDIEAAFRPVTSGHLPL